MIDPKIELTEKIQKLISEMQADNCSQPKKIIKTIDSWITTALTGNSIEPTDPKEILTFLGELNSIKLDYEAFIIEIDNQK